MEEISESSQRATGAVRSVVQALVVSLIALALPVLDALNVDAGAAQALLISIIMGVYWLLMNAIQNLPIVRGNPTLSAIVAILMGGSNPPSYIEVEVEDSKPLP